MFDPESFERLVEPPRGTPRQVDWAAVESRMGMALPMDYKWLIGRYGLGCFGDFLYIFCPESSRQGLDLEHQHERTGWALRYLAERGHSLPRSPGDLLSFGRSENGDVMYWIVDHGGDSSQWKVALGEPRGPLWEEFDGGAVEWLEAVLSKQVRMNIFPKDFPRRTVRFRAV
ncbi:SMI1/KNR4 family protein [Micromonospora carbonacea]|uniref:SMI1/KNR4 family protein n=1 Tax=Micromonospora carbonacea TaxID=47853 RepID=UPI00372375F8